MAICWRNTNQASGLALVYNLFHWLLTFFTSGLGALGGFCFGAGRLRSVSSESRLPRGLWSSLFWRRTEEGRPTVASKVGTPRRSLWWLELGSSLGGSGRRLSMSSSSLGSGRLTNRCSILICQKSLISSQTEFNSDQQTQWGTQHQRPESTSVTLTWHASKYKIDKNSLRPPSVRNQSNCLSQSSFK